MASSLIANEILNQLGGNRFIAMTGAKTLVHDDNSLRFRIGKNKSRANMIRITLNGLDLYDMEFIRYIPGKLIVNHKTQTVTTREEKTEVIKVFKERDDGIIFFCIIIELFNRAGFKVIFIKCN